MSLIRAYRATLTINDHDMNSIIQNLSKWFSTLPGVGPKTAEKYAYSFLRMPEETKEAFIASMRSSIKIVRCEQCQNFSSEPLCELCRDSDRDVFSLCVVADPQDIAVIERTKKFNGRYYVLHGLIAPLEGTTAESLHITKLLKQIQQNGVKDILLAFDQTMQGETTVSYLSKLLRELKVKISVLGRGVPTGADIEYADEATLSSALEGRKEI